MGTTNLDTLAVDDIQTGAGTIGELEIAPGGANEYLTTDIFGATAWAALNVTETDVSDSSSAGGLFVKKFAVALYDFSIDGGTEGTITLASTATIPDNAVVTAVSYDVITTCTSASDAATIKLNLPTDGDLTTAIAISDASNPWDAGAHSAVGALGAFTNAPTTQKTTAARALQIVTAGGEDLTAGKIAFAVEYYVTE